MLLPTVPSGKANFPPGGRFLIVAITFIGFLIPLLIRPARFLSIVGNTRSGRRRPGRSRSRTTYPTHGTPWDIGAAWTECRLHATMTPIRGDGDGDGGKVCNATMLNNGDFDDDEVYAAVVITSDQHGNTELQSRRMSVQQIINEVPGTHPRDFFSMSLTSLGDASRKHRAMRANHYSINNINIMHPWFILPRGSEIIVSCGIFWRGAYGPKYRRNLYHIILTHTSRNTLMASLSFFPN